MPELQSVNFRLQVWRPTPGQDVQPKGNNFQYTLVWQYRVTRADIESQSGILWRRQIRGGVIIFWGIPIGVIAVGGSFIFKVLPKGGNFF